MEIYKFLKEEAAQWSQVRFQSASEAGTEGGRLVVYNGRLPIFLSNSGHVFSFTTQVKAVPALRYHAMKRYRGLKVKLDAFLN
jgi:hypothetical protein